MSQEKSIKNHILENLAEGFSVKPARIKYVEEVLSPLSEEACKNWIFDFSKEGYKTKYLSIEKGTIRRAGGLSCDAISFTAEVGNEQEAFKIARTVYMDDEQVFIHLDNIHRTRGNGKTNFAWKSVKKLKTFINAQDKKRPDKNFLPSEIILEATSNNDKSGIASVGGYVWAVNGFDFASAEELMYVRKHFQCFARSKGVEIENEDLKYFTKPAHFASFHCGKLIKDKFGRSVHLGKAFLLIHEEWKGKMISYSGKNEEQRFAETYNQQPRSQSYRFNAFKVLNSKYKSMVKKYYDRYQATRILGSSMSVVEKYYQLLRNKLTSLGNF